METLLKTSVNGVCVAATSMHSTILNQLQFC